MTPLKLPLFVKYLAATSGLDYVLIKTKNMYVPNIDIQSCDNENIKTMLAGCYSTKTKFVTYQYSIEQHIYHTWFSHLRLNDQIGITDMAILVWPKRAMELKRYTCCFGKPGQLWLKVYGDLFICNANWQGQTRAPDYEAVGTVSLYFIAFAGFVDQFDHKNRVVKA